MNEPSNVRVRLAAGRKARPQARAQPVIDMSATTDESAHAEPSMAFTTSGSTSETTTGIDSGVGLVAAIVVGGTAITGGHGRRVGCAARNSQT